MPKRMLIDASHPEETRVIVVDGQRVDEFDFESATKRPLKGNIYLAKVTRVEPSLQAAFVEYGGNRQGFLAFSEIHPDYYQIPVADRMALIAEQQAEARRDDEEFEAVETGTAPVSDEELEAEAESEEAHAESESESENAADEDVPEEHVTGDESRFDAGQTAFADTQESDAEPLHVASIPELAAEEAEEGIVDEQAASDAAAPDAEQGGQPIDEPTYDNQAAGEEPKKDERPSQALRSQRPPQRWMRRRHYKIQEVIKRRQVMLVQVVKEERGTKGAALTTYLSLAGRYCVLMPNTPRGGGISRKITNVADRTRLKSAAATLELPEGMGLIIRTAGANRTKLEIKRDYEYLLRMWDQIRELTLKSNAPSCVYEEGDIIKRAIRDLYGKDIGEVLVEGEDAYRNAKDFMRMLMPSHAKNVKQYKDPVPVFQRYNIEAQLDAMFSPTVTLKSGGYIVINQTEALVSIDVNSGRATREHSIEETAHKTNLEAAEEIGRQLRLRDLAGLIVIDFIDMEDSRNDRDVERKLRDAVKNDRARVQIGKISQFGLLEMSRQRLRAGVVASSTIPCPHCGGQGIVRSVESTALRVLRALDEEGQHQRASAVVVKVANDVALYTLNQKRRELARIETDYEMAMTFEPRDNLIAGAFELERTIARAAPQLPQKPVISAETGFATPTDMEEPVEEEQPEEVAVAEDAPSGATNGQQQPGSAPKKKRRRRRRGKGHTQPGQQTPQVLSESIPSVSMPEEDVVTEGVPQQTAEPPSPQPAPQQSRSNGGQPQPGQGASSNSRRRRRRRKKPSGAPNGANVQPGIEASAANDHRDIERAPDTSRRPSHFEPPAPVMPNAPSTPVWSFGGEAPATSTTERKQAVRHEAPPARTTEAHGEVREQATVASRKPEMVETKRAAEHAPVAVEPQRNAEAIEEPQPRRAGWWQRQFKRG